MDDTAKPLWSRSAAWLVRAIADGEVSSREVVKAHLERIDEVNPALNAVTVVLAESAQEAARRADERRTQGEPLGPLYGVPFTIKEEIDVAGSATTDGVVAHKDAIPALDAPIVARLRAAGAIPLARTNLPDFGMRLHTMNALWGATRNPWDPTRTPGGSSGGEAAALATGMSPLGLGADIGGSLRNPSYCCGTAALKPTLGRFPQAYSLDPELSPASQLMAVSGPMARHIEDLRLAMGVMTGVDPRDPWSMPAPVEGPPMRSPIGVAVVPEPPGGPTHPSVAAAVREAAAALADAGYALEEVTPPRMPEIARLWHAWIGTETAVEGEEMLSLMCDEARRFLELANAGIEPSLESLLFCLMARNTIGIEWGTFGARYPLVLGPVWTQPPWEVGYDVAGEAEALDVLNQIRFTVTANFLGLPAVAVPVGVSDGLPRGVQLIGPRFREDLCLDAAAAIETRLGVLTPINPRPSRST